VLAEHRRLVRAAIAARGGREVDAQGDAFFAVFGAARQAVLCALDVQRVLTAHRWPSGAVVRVRIGVHTGTWTTATVKTRAGNVSSATAGLPLAGRTPEHPAPRPQEANGKRVITGRCAGSGRGLPGLAEDKRGPA
jgi:hypothetical protein